jgi:hypothetical protein
MGLFSESTPACWLCTPGSTVAPEQQGAAYSPECVELDFSHSRRVAKRVAQAFHEGLWDFYRVGRRRRPAKSCMCPQLFAH